MKDIKDIFFVVQARESSQRIPFKMTKPFAGTTLLDICLEKIIASDIPEENFYLSAYEQEIKNIGRQHGVNIFHRSKKSAESSGLPLSEIFDWAVNSPWKYVIMINGCAPLLTVPTINQFIRQYIQTEKTGLFSVFVKQNYFWNLQGECINKEIDQRNLDTKKVTPLYEAAHCLYGSSMESVNNGYWMGDYSPGNPELFIMEEQESWDIDYPWQFTYIEALYKREKT